jgi:predicted PurR-regulated permease PerM
MNTSRDVVRQAIDVAISLILVAILLFWCLRIIEPFSSFVIWGAVIAAAVHGPYRVLARRLNGNRSLATALFVVVALTAVLVPAFLFVETLLASTGALRAAIASGEFRLPSPSEDVRAWPLVGERIYSGWSEAASGLREFLAKYPEQTRRVGETLLSQLAGAGVAVLQFVLASLIAAAFLHHGEAAGSAARAFFRRLVGDEQAGDILTLSSATIRSVAVGVLGIAFVQALLGGLGMVVLGVPAAGMLALAILVVAIAQLPPWLILLPVTLYVFSEHSTLVGVLFAVWSLLVSFADAVLKPLVLGRGVEAPMPVILLGAIGGLLISGIIGLFVGAVVLALGYRLVQLWLADGDADKVLEQAVDD